MTSLFEPIAAGIAVAIFNKYILNSSTHCVGATNSVARRRRGIACPQRAPR